MEAGGEALIEASSVASAAASTMENSTVMVLVVGRPGLVTSAELSVVVEPVVEIKSALGSEWIVGIEPAIDAAAASVKSTVAVG